MWVNELATLGRLCYYAITNNHRWTQLNCWLLLPLPACLMTTLPDHNKTLQSTHAGTFVLLPACLYNHHHVCAFINCTGFVFGRALAYLDKHWFLVSRLLLYTSSTWTVQWLTHPLNYHQSLIRWRRCRRRTKEIPSINNYMRTALTRTILLCTSEQCLPLVKHQIQLCPIP